MFSFITQNWRGRPLISHETIVNSIGSTRTATGLKIRAKLNSKTYPIGVKVTDSELARVRIKPATFHGEWNYTVTPDSD